MILIYKTEFLHVFGVFPDLKDSWSLIIPQENIHMPLQPQPKLIKQVPLAETINYSPSGEAFHKIRKKS